MGISHNGDYIFEDVEVSGRMYSYKPSELDINDPADIRPTTGDTPELERNEYGDAFVGQGTCPECGPSDNIAETDTGASYCLDCGTVFKE